VTKAKKHGMAPREVVGGKQAESVKKMAGKYYWGQEKQ
jgi:hypothetical protein